MGIIQNIALKVTQKFIIHLSIFIGFIPSVLWAQEASTVNSAPRGMTLEECINFAIKNAEGTRNANLDIQIAEGRVNETKSEGLPQVNAKLGLTANPIIQRMFLPAEFAGLDPGEPPVAAPFGVAYLADAGISASQLIFDGAFFVGLKAAKTYKELSAKSYTRSKIEVIEAVSKAYYGVLVAEERLKLVDQNYSRVDTLLKQTRAMYENGLSEKLDVDRIRVSFNNIKNEQNKAVKMLNVNLAMLKFQMGMDIREKITLADGLRDHMDENLMMMEEINYFDRIEYSLLQTQEELDELNVRQLNSRYMPTLYLNAQYGFNTGSDAFNEVFHFGYRWFDFAMVGLTLNIPIFDGFLKRSQIQQAKLQRRQTENSMMNMRNSIDFENYQAKINYENALSDLEIQEDNLELAQEVFNVSKIKFQEGVGSVIEITDAETSFKEAEINYYSALYDLLISKVDYLKSVGKLDENIAAKQ